MCKIWWKTAKQRNTFGEHFPCDGDLHLHLVLTSDDSLVITESVVEASSCLGFSPDHGTRRAAG